MMETEHEHINFTAKQLFAADIEFKQQQSVTTRLMNLRDE